MEKIIFVNDSVPALNATNLNRLQDNAEEAINELKSKSAKLSITEDTEKGAEVTIPLQYKVGAFSLDVYLNGEKLIACSEYDDNTLGHFSEVGDKNAISSTIKLTDDWNLNSGDYLEIIVKGDWS